MYNPFGSTSNEAYTPDREITMSTTPETLARAVLDALNSRQLEHIRDLVTDDFVDHGSPVQLPPGPDGYIAILTFATEVLQVRYELHDVVASGDTVAIRATAHGINTVSPQGIEPTGRAYAMTTAHFFRARDGRLCEHWGVRDELDVLYQVGALTPPELPLPAPT
jgi:predicted ester cyclase